MLRDDTRAAEQPRTLVTHDRLELVKWIAVLAMTVDHVGKIVDPSIYYETNAIGRITYPLFAWIIGVRLSIDPSLGRQYIVNLLPWALASQPIYMFVGKQWYEPNIFFTLSLGVIAHNILFIWADRLRSWRIFAFVTVLFVALFVEYGAFGVLTIPLVATLFDKRPIWGIVIIAPLGVLSNLTILAPYFGPGGAWALLSLAVVLLCLRSNFRIWRLPKQVFYAYYPLHLLALYAYARF